MAAHPRQISVPRALLFLLVFGLCALATQAKLSQYRAKDSPTHYISKSVKMHESRAETGEEAQLSAQALPAPEELAGELLVLFPETNLPKTFSILRPFEFRPPPFAGVRL